MCEYSFLYYNDHPTYAVMKKELKASGVERKNKQVNWEKLPVLFWNLDILLIFGKRIRGSLIVALSQTRELQEEERW